MHKVVIYTSIFGGYDKAVIRPIVRSPALFSFVCLTDAYTEVIYPYEKVEVPYEGDPRKASRRCKILSHEMFPDADVTIWHGGNVQVRGNMTNLLNVAWDSGIAILKHSLRNCVYHEAKVCIDNNLDDSTIVNAQMERYRQDGFPRNYGLSAAFLIVRYNRKEIDELNEMWWGEVDNNSIRDQLSFDYCAYKMGISPGVIPGDIFKGPYHERFPTHERAT